MANTKAVTPRVWIFMVDSRNSSDLRDLDHLDEILWGSNPNTRSGDIVLIYRTAPYSDIAYVFRAKSDPRPTQRADQADTEYVIELEAKTRLSRPLTLKEIRNSSCLSSWAFARHQQGAMRRKKDIREEGYWRFLRELLIASNPGLRRTLATLERNRASSRGAQISRTSGPTTARAGRQLRVFISYASPDLDRVWRLYRRLRQEQGLDLWFDKKSLIPAEDWFQAIRKAIRSCDIILICLSSRSMRRTGFAQREIAWGLELADEQPDEATCILPVKLEQCELRNRRLAHYQYAELFRKGGYERIVTGLQKRAAYLEASEAR